MASLRKNQGHRVTSSLPSSSDAVQQRPVNLSFPRGGGMTDSQRGTAKKKFPPAS